MGGLIQQFPTIYNQQERKCMMLIGLGESVKASFCNISHTDKSCVKDETKHYWVIWAGDYICGTKLWSHQGLRSDTQEVRPLQGKEDSRKMASLLWGFMCKLISDGNMMKMGVAILAILIYKANEPSCLTRLHYCDQLCYKVAKLIRSWPGLNCMGGRIRSLHAVHVTIF